MSLPIIALPTSTVEVGGVPVPIRSLSRHEALHVHSFVGREDEAEDYIVACGTDVSVEEAAKWRNSTALDTAGTVVGAIMLISGLTKAGTDPNAPS